MKQSVDVVVKAPIESVFAAWSDVEHYSEWAEPVLERKKVSEGPIGVGTRFQAKDRWPGRTVEFDMEITEYEQDRRLGAKWSEPMEGSWTSTLSEVAGGTRLQFEMEVKLPLMMRLLSPLMKYWANRQQAKFISAFKQRVESA